MNQVNWFQVFIDILQAVISGVFVGLVIYWLDERRAKRERRLSDYRIASNWDTTEPKVTLRNFDLTKANLSGLKFVGANFERAVIREGNMWATDFTEANLREVDFRKAMLVGVRFKRATVYDANFSWATIKKTDDFDQKNLLDFSDAIFKGVKFIGTELKGIAMVEANLQNADFSKAVVQDCDFTNADITKSNWLQVKSVSDCTWVGVKYNDETKIPENLLNEIRKQNEK